jgi:putative membrane-bound dehydrogenase-like protein
MAFDDRGRLWVAEAYSYPVRVAAAEARDRILIFEDTDGDDVFDSRKVFVEGLNLVSGLELGFGGVWVGAAPELLFYPDRDGDDRPDGEPEVLLDGWATRTRMKRSTRSSGAPTAGSTDATACSRTRPSVHPGRPTPSG